MDDKAITQAYELEDYSQRREALDVTSHVLVKAPAGAGKTTLLTQRVLATLKTVAEPERVVALTFTNKAANEMRSRVITALSAAANNDPDERDSHTLLLAREVLKRDKAFGWNLLANPNRLRIMTIDRFNAQLAAQVPLLSGFGSVANVAESPQAMYVETAMRLLDEINDERLTAEERQALQAVFGFGANRHDLIVPFLADMLAKREQWLRLVAEGDSLRQMPAIVDDLITAKLRAVASGLSLAKAVELIVLAQQANTEPLAWAVGATAGALDTSVASLKLWRGISACLLTKDGKLRAKLTAREGFPAKQPCTAAANAILEDLRTVEGTIVPALAGVGALPDAGYPDSMKQLASQMAVCLRRLYAHLQIVFQERSRVDFQEVAQRALRALVDADGVNAAALKAEAQIEHILVDEFQDTSVAQMDLLQILTLNWLPGDGRSLFMVGDPMQSIYGFRQAEVRIFNSLWESGVFSHLTLKRLQLRTNFRSSRVLVDAFNKAFPTVLPGQSDSFTGAVAYSPCAAALTPTAGDGVCLTVVPGNEDQEAEVAARAIAESVAARPGETVAALARSRSHLRALVSHLARLNVRFSCQDVDPLLQSDAVRDAVHLARAAWHPQDRLSWVGLLHSPLVGLSWADISALVEGNPKRPLLDAMRDGSQTLSAEGRARVVRFLDVWNAANAAHPALVRLVEVLWHGLGGPATIGQGELADVSAVFRLLAEHSVGGGLEDVSDFEDALRTLYATPSSGDVVLMTIHSAKGLEFSEVHVVGLGTPPRNEDRPLLHYRNTPRGFLLAANPGRIEDEGGRKLFDFVHSLHEESREHEEARLLYVAATRAQRRLCLYGVGATDSAGAIEAPKGSYLAGLTRVLPAVVAHAGPVAPVVAGKSVPRAPRLALDWAYPSTAGGYRPVANLGTLPSEMVLANSHEGLGDGEGVDRAVGILYHQIMETMTSGGVEALKSIGSRHKALAARLRHLGLPEPRVDGAVARVIRLIERTAASSHGAWFTDPANRPAVEVALAGFAGQKWNGGIIDRLLDDGTAIWVIDYKTAGEGLAGQAASALLQAEAVRYAPQLAQYKRLVEDAFAGRTVRTALYFPAFDELVETH